MNQTNNKKVYLFVAFLLFISQASCALLSNPTQPVVASNPPVSPMGLWQPASGTMFQLQFDGEFDPSIQADIYDLDLFDTEPSIIAALHAQGKRVVCYVSVGSWEDWRPDAARFPANVLGRDYEGWPGEKWLDVRQIDELAPIMRARFDLCAAKGFDGLEPDNVEGYDNETGFPLTYQDQLNYAVWLAGEAHARNLAIGLKNAPDMAADVLAQFDFAVLEDCHEYGWCADLLPFVQAGKPVFAIEYTDTGIDFTAACAQEQPLGLTVLLKNRNLDAYRRTCP